MRRWNAGMTAWSGNLHFDIVIPLFGNTKDRKDRSELSIIARTLVNYESESILSEFIFEHIRQCPCALKRCQRFNIFLIVKKQYLSTAGLLIEAEGKYNRSCRNKFALNEKFDR